MKRLEGEELVLGLGERCHLVGLHALVFDDALPVEAEAEVVGVALGVGVAVHVAGHVLELGLHGVHVLGHLELQQAGGLDFTGDDAGVAVGRDVEAGAGRTGVARPAHEGDVGVRLDLREDHRMVGVDDENQLGIGRQLGLGVDDQVEVALVGGMRGLAVVAAVLHGNAGLGAVLRPSLAIGGVAGLGAEHARRALDAVVGVLRVLDLDDGVFDVDQLLGSEARDVALLELGLGLALERLAGGGAPAPCASSTSRTTATWRPPSGTACPSPPRPTPAATALAPGACAASSSATAASSPLAARTASSTWTPCCRWRRARDRPGRREAPPLSKGVERSLLRRKGLLANAAGPPRVP